MRRIAIVGTDRRSTSGDDFQITTCRWDSLSRLGNIRDYDDLILSLPSGDSDDEIDWDAFWEMFTPESFLGIVGHEGRVIVIGDARLGQELRSRMSGAVFTTPLIGWTGLKFTWDSKPANTTTVSYPSKFDGLQSYLDSLRHVGYSLDELELTVELPESYVRATIANWGNFAYGNVRQVLVVPQVVPLSRTRYLAPTAFAVVMHQLLADSGGRKLYSYDLGPLLLLPANSMPLEDRIDLILSDYLEVATVEHEPPWVEDSIVPGQAVVEEIIAGLDTQIEQLQDVKEARLRERSKLRSILRLLYDRDDGLEEIVRSAFERLGATVEEPTEPGKEDGWIFVDLDGVRRAGVLEVKSTRRDTFNEEGLKQLHQWKLQGAIKGLRVEEIKGVFVGNAAYDRNQSEREDPFPHNWIKTAEASGHIALDSCTLFIACSEHAEGRLDIEGFWRLIFDTRGVIRDDDVQRLVGPS